MIKSISEITNIVNDKGFFDRTKYLVSINAPPQVNISFDTTTELIYCNKVSLPSFQLETVAQMALNIPEEVPNNLKYGDEVEMTFYCDRNLSLYYKFYKWIDSAGGGPLSGHKGYNMFVDDIAGDIAIESYMATENGLKKVATYRSFKSYPTKLSEIELEYDGADSIFEFTVTFFVHDLTIIPGSISSFGDLINAISDIGQTAKNALNSILRR